MNLCSVASKVTLFIARHHQRLSACLSSSVNEFSPSSAICSFYQSSLNYSFYICISQCFLNIVSSVLLKPQPLSVVIIIYTHVIYRYYWTLYTTNRACLPFYIYGFSLINLLQFPPMVQRWVVLVIWILNLSCIWLLNCKCMYVITLWLMCSLRSTLTGTIYFFGWASDPHDSEWMYDCFSLYGHFLFFLENKL